MAVAVCYLMCALIWGTTWFVIRESTPADGFPIYVGAAVRFTIAAGSMWALLAVGVGGPLPRGRPLRWLVLAGAVNAISYGLVYTAEREDGGLPGGLVAVLFGTIPLVTAVAATVFKIERITPGQIAGALVSLIGIALVSADRLAVDRAQALSVVAALGAVVASVMYAILARRGMEGVSPWSATLVFLTVTALVSWLPALAQLGDTPWPPARGPVVATLYLAVLGSVVAFACYFYLLKRVRLMVASSLILLQPVIALLVDAAFERRVRLGALTYLGVAITLSGVAVNLLVKAGIARRAGRVG